MTEAKSTINSILGLYDQLHKRTELFFPQTTSLLPNLNKIESKNDRNGFKIFENFTKPSQGSTNQMQSPLVMELANQEFKDPTIEGAIMLHPSHASGNQAGGQEMAISITGSKFKGRPKMKEHPKWRLKRVVAGHNGWVRSVSFDPSNEFFATGSTDSTIKFWDLASGVLKLTFTGHVSSVRCVEISKQHPYLFSSSEDKSVRCWDLNTNKCIRNFHGHLSGVYTLSLHPELNIFASGGRDAVVRLWDIRSRQQIHVFEGHGDTVNSVVMQKDEPQLMSASSDSTIRLWDIVSGKTFNVLTNHKKGIRALRPHPVEYSFVSGAADNIKLWKCPEGSFIRNLEKPAEYEIINSIDVSGEDVMVAGYDNGKMRFWDWESGLIFQTIESAPQPGSLEAEAGIFDLKFDHSSTRLVTCECDKTIKIWQQETE
jgi:pleiotropic regulator 1